MKVKIQRRNYLKQQEHVFITHFDMTILIVSLMRHEVHVKVKYDEDNEKLEESKEEEMPLN